MTADEALPNGTLGTAELHNEVQEALQRDPRKLTMPVKTVQDKYELLPAFLKVRALALTEQTPTHPRKRACCCRMHGQEQHLSMIFNQAAMQRSPAWFSVLP